MLREFVYDAARLAVRHGGSCSGEHGDGRARSELLPPMYSERTLELFAGVKEVFDPDDRASPMRECERFAGNPSHVWAAGVDVSALPISELPAADGRPPGSFASD